MLCTFSPWTYISVRSTWQFMPSIPTTHLDVPSYPPSSLLLTPDIDQVGAVRVEQSEQSLSWADQYERQLASLSRSSTPVTSKATSAELYSSPPMEQSSPYSEDVFLEDESDDDESESEHDLSGDSPTPRLAPLRERPAYTRTRTQSAPSSSRPSPSFFSKALRTPRRRTASFPSGSSIPPVRRMQVELILDAEGKVMYPDADGSRCSIPECDYDAPNGRASEMQRHIETHFTHAYIARFGPDYVCCGRPLEDLGDEYASAAKWCAFTQCMMVRGCGRVFTRRDAYFRHLADRSKIKGSCWGDPTGQWMPDPGRHRSKLTA